MGFVLSRKTMTRVMLLLIVTMTWFVAGDAGGTKPEERLFNIEKLEMFVDKLPHIPTLHGFHIVNGVLKPKSLQIGMFFKKWKFHRDLPATPVFAYGVSKHKATVPGPTIEAVYGVSTYVTWRNHLPSSHILPWDPTISPAIAKRGGIPTVVHLHGGIHEPSSDGNADSWFTAGFKETGTKWTKPTYHYVNKQQPGNMWYHDHAAGLTRVNLLAGLLGAYILRHSSVETPLKLPTGREFDRPLIVFDRSFRKDGSIYMNATGNNPTIHPQWQPEYFGDAIVVNGKAWPRLTVRRRKYRFRIINASNARFFGFFFSNGLDFIVIGSDSAYLAKPVSTKSVLLAPSEIVDVAVDFSKSTSKTAILANNAPYPYPSGDPVTDENSKVMKFIIKHKSETDTSSIPTKLVQYPHADVSKSVRTRYIAMFEYVSSADEPTHLYINGLPYNAPVTETPKIGTSEVWEVINLTEDNHPLHIHLGLFRVLEQTALVETEKFTDCMTEKNDAVKCQISKYARGNKTAVTAHERGWKNVFKMMPGHVTKILVRFSYVHSNESYSFDATQEPGYVYHCHILDHEDNMMMRPFAVVKKMLKNNCMPDNALLSTLIHWLCRDGRVTEARKLLDEFEKGSIPSLLTYNTLISGMCEKGELTEAGRLWDDMVERKCKPNAFTYNVLIEGLCKMGNVKEGKEEDGVKIVSMAVKSGKVDRECWELFLRKFAGELDKGEVVLKELLQGLGFVMVNGFMLILMAFSSLRLSYPFNTKKLVFFLLLYLISF
ncbi:hypothetical protein HID58_072997 [Brassica napus]|uniref:Uncharacterized protein n=2 Tax=Brassica napus TaxID=3708 RepID=A0ABQ7Z6A0_BRANA|nr:hypothetical protein HID58_072997 [Brassica napus]